jgi:uncharacterized membrane protein
MSLCLPHRRRATVLALCLASLLCAALVMARMSYTGKITFTFLSWNLILAWVPFVAASLLQDAHRRRKGLAVLLPLGLLWLVFYPNAPYIVTDFIHLNERRPVPLWFDIALLSSFAWTGLMLGFLSLYQVQTVLRDRTNALLGWIFVLTISVLSGFGVYVGRELRWNSWDVVVNPGELLADLWARITQPFVYPGSVGVSIVFGVFLFVAYLVIETLVRQEDGERRKA